MTEKTAEHPVQHRLKLRNLRLSDYEDIYEIMEVVYHNMDGAWSREQFASQIARFPEGQICIEAVSYTHLSAIAPPWEKPASTMRSAGMPRRFSRSTNAKIPCSEA